MLAALREYISSHTLKLVCVIASIAIITAFLYLSNAGVRITQENAVTGAQRYLEALAEFRTLYTSEVVSIAKKNGLTVTHNYNEVEGAIPLPASLSMALGEKIGRHQSGAKTFLYSRYPFPWRESENKNLFSQQFPQQAWASLTKNPEQAFYRFENYLGRPSIRYAIADRMREACISCHNNHPDTPKNDWREGDVRGVMEVILPIDIAQQATQSSLTATFTVLALMAFLLMFAFGVVYARLRKDTSELAQNNTVLQQSQIEVEAKNDEIQSAHRQLQDHAQELKQTLQYKSDFLACMSHEIRTPMNGVLGMLHLLQQTPLLDDQRHKANLAQTSAQSLLVIINDILDFSKVDSGKLTLEMVDFDLQAMLSEFCQTMSLAAHEKGLELIVDLTDVKQTTVCGDAGRLRQVLTNLVANAIKFTAHGEIIIRCGLSADDEAGWTFSTSVTDTGIGIPAPKQSDLFDAFTQADNSVTRKYGGTGLGLSICKKLCELMAGSIKVSSKVDHGSVFEFNIKLSSASQFPKLQMEQSLDNLPILVVDDNFNSRQTLAKQLRAWGAKAHCAQDAEVALKMLAANAQQSQHKRIKVLFVDLHMPGTSGVQLVNVIRQDVALCDLKLVLMTSINQTEEQDSRHKDSVDAVFSKPLMPADLINALSILPVEDLKSLAQVSHNANVIPLQHPDWPEEFRVLLAEDSLINQEVALGILANVGLTAATAINGNEVLEMLRAAPDDLPFCVIIMDCQMPELDGYRATALIRAGRAGQRYVDIPIVALTANIMRGDQRKCFDAGMNDYLSKPIEPAQLLLKLQKSAGIIVPVVEQSGQVNAVITADNDTPVVHKNIWDEQALIQRLGGNKHLTVSLLEHFLDAMPDKVKQLQSLVASKHSADAATVAHEISGVALNISASALQLLAQAIDETRSEERQSELLPDLVVAYREVSAKLRNYLVQHDSKAEKESFRRH